MGAAIDMYFGGTGQVGYMIGSAHGPSVVPEVIEGEPAPIGAIFGGEAGAELVFPSGVTMSLLNVWVSPERALVAVDTDAITPDGQHFGMSKLLVLPHSETVFAFRGDRRFMHDLFGRFYLARCDVDLDAIVSGMGEMLASVILGLREAGKAPLTSR